MKTARLKVLGLEVPIQSCVEYYDHGFVKDVDRYSHMLKIKYKRVSDKDYQKDPFKIHYGRYLGFRTLSGTDHYIFYVDSGSPIVNTEIKAHEETHALAHMFGLHILSGKMLEEHKVNLVFNEFDEEMQCDLGSVYALLKHHYKINSHRDWDTMRSNFRGSKKALEIYDRAALSLAAK